MTRKTKTDHSDLAIISAAILDQPDPTTVILTERRKLMTNQDNEAGGARERVLAKTEQTLQQEVEYLQAQRRNRDHNLIQSLEKEVSELRLENTAWDVLCAEHLDKIKALRKEVRRGK